MPPLLSPSWAEVRALAKAHFPHASVVPDWLLLIEKLTNGLYYNRDGVLTPIAPVAPVTVADGVGIAVPSGAALDLRQNRAQLHLGNSDSVDGAYVLGLDNQAWFSAGLHFDGASWRADQTGVGMVFGMFAGALNFYTSTPTTVGVVATLTLRATLSDGGLVLPAIGGGLHIKEGANAKMGIATLAAGTVTVSNTTVTANSRIFLTTQVPGGTVGTPYVSARTAGTSFTITSTSGTDTSQVAWQIVEPAA